VFPVVGPENICSNVQEALRRAEAVFEKIELKALPREIKPGAPVVVAKHQGHAGRSVEADRSAWPTGSLNMVRWR
jgi:hypothetical protein